MTPTRRLVRQRMLKLSQQLGPQKRVLEVGIAGDDPPGANREFFKADLYETLDKDADLKPTYVVDIEGEVPAERTLFDLVICSQVLEHCWRPVDAVKNLWTYLTPGGHCIIDVPFLYPPHSDEREKDYWRFSPDCVKRMAELAGFTVVEIITDPDWLLITVLLQKGQPS